ncbi:MAG: 6-bladed beta-propeller [Desulfobacterales bacterium]|nr:6-bladed beta-propeller [Desulfobacterales bacterium]
MAALTGLAYSPKPPAWKGNIAKEGSVVVVKNPAKPLYGPEAFSLVEEISIGGDASPDALLASITSIAEGPDGSIYVLDQEDRNVKAFDRGGKYLRTIGRQGQGPGGLSAPISVHWTAAG